MGRSVGERLVEAVQARDIERYAALFAEDAVAHHPLADEPARGRDAIRASEQALYDAFSEVQITVRSVLTGERGGAVELVLRATNTGPLDMGEGEPLPPTGRTVEFPAVWCWDVGPDGLIVEARDYFDSATFLAQLGLGEPEHAGS